MTKSKEGSFKVMAIFFIVTILITFGWDKIPFLKNGVHAALDPSLGALLSWQLELGMIIILLFLSIISVVVQKYTTNQEELKKIRATQKELQSEAKKNANDPKKMNEINTELMSLAPKQMKLGMRSVIYTGIPFFLFFRWFHDYFLTMGSPKFFGFMGWFWFYLIVFMIFSTILKKKFDVV